MDLKLAGKTALVTGSTAGIGFAIASQLADEGARVIISGRSQVRVDEAVGRLHEGKMKANVTGVPAVPPPMRPSS